MCVAAEHSSAGESEGGGRDSVDEIHRETETEIREMNGITWGANFGINFVGQCIACVRCGGCGQRETQGIDGSPFTVLISTGRARGG